MAKRRKKNPEQEDLLGDIDAAIRGSGKVIDARYEEYEQIHRDLSAIDRIEDQMPSGTGIPREIRIRKRALQMRERELDKWISTYARVEAKRLSNRLDEIEKSPLAKLRRQEIRNVRKEIFKIESLAKRKGTDVRPAVSRAKGGVVTLEQEVTIDIPVEKEAPKESAKDRSQMQLQMLLQKAMQRWASVRKHSKNHERFFIRRSTVHHKKYGPGIVIKSDNRRVTMRPESGGSDVTVAITDLTPGPVFAIDTQFKALDEKFKRGREITKGEVQRLVKKIADIHNMTKPRHSLRTYAESKRALDAFVGRIQTKLVNDKMDSESLEQLIVELDELAKRVPSTAKAEWSRADQRQWANDILKVRKGLVKLRRKANPCVGFHFHSKDADELLRAIEASNARQRKSVKKNPGKKKSAKKKATRKKAPEWKKLINKCQKNWDHYCERPGKKRLKEVFAHLEEMKKSDSKRVKEERAACLRIANKEAKRLGMKK